MSFISKEEIKKSIEKNGKYWIVFTGDSLTSCEWVHPNWREIVEYVLQEEMTKYLGDWKKSEWSIRGFNFAFDGATTKDILERTDNLKLVRPNLVIGLMGGNDPLFDISVEDHVKNTESIINSLIQDEMEVVWFTSIPALPSAKKMKVYPPYAEALMKMQPREHFHLIDLFNIYKQFPLDRIFTFKSEENPEEGIKEGETDPGHPNQLGNAYIAKVILKEVFDIEFDTEKYIKETLEGKKFPNY